MLSMQAFFFTTYLAKTNVSIMSVKKSETNKQTNRKMLQFDFWIRENTFQEEKKRVKKNPPTFCELCNSPHHHTQPPPPAKTEEFDFHVICPQVSSIQLQPTFEKNNVNDKNMIAIIMNSYRFFPLLNLCMNSMKRFQDIFSASLMKVKISCL